MLPVMPRFPLAMVLYLCAAPPLCLGAGEAEALWTGKVQAILDQHCVKCHGPLEEKGGLLLDTREAVMAGGESGPVVVPGQPEESPLVTALAAEADPHMPPKKQLEESDIATLRAWVIALAQQPEPAPPALTAEAEPAPQSIDEFLEQDWKAKAISPAPLADDRAFLRRLLLDLIGRIPTPEEMEAFLFDASPHKRAALADRLLASDEAARHFREVWDALLLGRRNGRVMKRREDEGWFEFLEATFKNSRPWNEAVAAIIEARPAKPEDKGSVLFVFERRNEHQQIAEAIAPVIYGTRIDCAQCHDHALAREIKQGHYWGLVAAFNRSKNVDKGPPAVSESAVGGFINFTNLKKESQAAVITMLGGPTIEEQRPAPEAKEEDTPELYGEPQGEAKVPKFSRRAALARAATENNPLLARSFVNHTWALFFGRGIVHPVDEMNSKTPPSHPALLDWLAQDFAENGFNIKRLYRQIALSRAYQLAAPPAPADAPPPATFAAALEKPLTAEAIARSARIAAGLPPEDTSLRRAFADTFPDVLPRVTLATVQQAMYLTNDPDFSGIFAPNPALEAIAALPAAQDRVRAIFRRALQRDPDAEELAEAAAFLKERAEKPAEATGHLLWALASGPEFLTNH